MNHLLRTLCAFSLLLLAGCFQVDTVVRVNPDGSGTVVETMMLSKKMLAQMNEMMQGFAGEGGAKPQPIDLYEPAKLKAEAAGMGAGVSFKSAKRAETADYSGYTVTYAFKDINKLKLNQQKGSTGGDKSPSSPVLFHFKKGSPAQLTIEMPKGKTVDKNADAPKEDVDAAPTNKVVSEEEAKKLLETFMGMKMALSVEVNGAIVKTNATHLSGNRITIVDLDLAKFGSSLPQLEKLKQLQTCSLADAKELLKDFPGMKIDMNDRLTVVFTK
ncbi:MAG TPA: hypothetical protein VF799_08120 [Geobacteraceae bacterium]